LTSFICMTSELRGLRKTAPRTTAKKRRSMAKRDSQGKGPKCDSNPALRNRVLAIAHMEIVNMNASLATKKVSREKTIYTLPEFFTGRPDEIGMRDIIVRKQRMEAIGKRISALVIGVAI